MHILQVSREYHENDSNNGYNNTNEKVIKTQHFITRFSLKAFSLFLADEVLKMYRQSNAKNATVLRKSAEDVNIVNARFEIQMNDYNLFL